MERRVEIHRKRNKIIILIIIVLCITQIILPITICFSPKTKYIYKTGIVKPKEYYEFIWKIKIPKINLNANISDGTDEANLNKYVAHFTQSAYILGNVCLAAHNRGYNVNYFHNIKKLKKGDDIIYEFKNLKLKYVITENKIIKDTDVDILKNSKQSKITLITCVENQPSKRRCIQGILKI